MRLSKTYSGKFFLQPTLEQAIDVWLQHHNGDLASSEFLILETESGEETWSHDSYAEFLGQYAPSKDRIHLSIRLLDEEAKFGLNFNHYGTSISIESQFRESIDSVASVFDASSVETDYVRVSGDSRFKKIPIRKGEDPYREERRMEVNFRVITSDNLLELAK